MGTVLCVGCETRVLSRRCRGKTERHNLGSMDGLLGIEMTYTETWVGDLQAGGVDDRFEVDWGDRVVVRARCKEETRGGRRVACLYFCLSFRPL